MFQQLIKTHAQAVQVLHALKYYGTPQEKATLAPEVDSIIADISFQHRDLLIPATNKLIEAYLEMYGEFSPDVTAAIMELLGVETREVCWALALQTVTIYERWFT